MNEGPKGMEQDDARDKILLAALPHVAFDGWVDRTLKQGVEDAGYPPDMRLRAFPGGAMDMIAHWSAYSDRRMLEDLEAQDLDAMRVRDRIAAGVQARISVNAPYREAVRRTLAVLALPPNGLLGARLTYNTINAIWYAAGDTAADFSFYTKRVLLTPVYLTTILYWLDDESEDTADTWAFLGRRIDDVMEIPKIQARLQKAMPSPMRWLNRSSRPLKRSRPA